VIQGAILEIFDKQKPAQLELFVAGQITQEQLLSSLRVG
jgi:hypothetical protein